MERYEGFANTLNCFKEHHSNFIMLLLQEEERRRG